jgi:hypothetical protein
MDRLATIFAVVTVVMMVGNAALSWVLFPFVPLALRLLCALVGLIWGLLAARLVLSVCLVMMVRKDARYGK